MRKRLTSMIAHLRPRTAEDGFILIFALSTFIGIGYALPMLNVIKDATGFAGGVLRSIEGHTLLPGLLNYGTVTFYICYAVIGIFLVLAFPFYHFSIAAMTTGLVNHPEYVYVISRAVSAAGIAALILYAHRFLKEEVQSALYRVAIIVSVFGSILITALSRSGKVWVLSAAFGAAAVIACCQSVRKETFPGKYAALSIYLTALAVANFILIGLYGIVVFILAYFFRHSGAWKKLAIYCAGAAALAIFITALNYQDLYNLVLEIFTHYHPLFTTAPVTHVQLSFFPSLGIHVLQLLQVYPLILLLLLFALVAGIANKRQLWIGIIVATVYFLAITFVANWYSDTATYVRYMYPLGFLFIPILAAFKPPHRSILWIVIVLNILIYLHTIILLVMPATYNLAVEAVTSQYGSSNVVIENYIFELDLPMNKASYALLDAKNCATKCEYALSQSSDIAFKPVVQTIYSSAPTSTSPRLIVAETPLPQCGDPIIKIGPPVQPYLDIEYGLGTYFDPAFYTLQNLGKHIFVYERAHCPQLVVPQDTPQTNTLGDS